MKPVSEMEVCEILEEIKMWVQRADKDWDRISALVDAVIK